MDRGERLPCPQCGALNYATDAVCLGCGWRRSSPRREREVPPPPSISLEPEGEAGKRKYRPSRPGLISIFCGVGPVLCVLLAIGALWLFHTLGLDDAAPWVAGAFVLAMPLFALIGLVAGGIALRRRDLVCGIIGLVVCALELIGIILVGIVVWLFASGTWGFG
jgi:hypothetical protein